MLRIRYLLSPGVALASLSLVTGIASGDGGTPAQDTQHGSPEWRAQALFTHGTVETQTLDGQRGGADSRLSKILATGTVDEVAASDLVTGNNIVTDGALANTSGIPMLIQNTGNGVLIQNAVIVNVELN
jgi:hypothetical protein